MKYKYIGTDSVQYAEWQPGYYTKLHICPEQMQYAAMPLIVPGDAVVVIRRNDNFSTFYIPRLDISASTNRIYFDLNFEPIIINYNDYWAKLNA